MTPVHFHPFRVQHVQQADDDQGAKDQHRTIEAREWTLFVFDHNRQIDINRGIAKPDMFAGRSVDGGPCPGGNVEIPP